MSSITPQTIQNVSHLLNLRIERMETALAIMQASLEAKKAFDVMNVMKRLHPLAEEVYNEVLPEKYKIPIFTKFSGNSDP